MHPLVAAHMADTRSIPTIHWEWAKMPIGSIQLHLTQVVQQHPVTLRIFGTEMQC